jgi:hypothetical protein
MAEWVIACRLPHLPHDYLDPHLHRLGAFGDASEGRDGLSCTLGHTRIIGVYLVRDLHCGSKCL